MMSPRSKSSTGHLQHKTQRGAVGRVVPNLQRFPCYPNSNNIMVDPHEAAQTASGIALPSSKNTGLVGLDRHSIGTWAAPLVPVRALWHYGTMLHPPSQCAPRGEPGLSGWTGIQLGHRHPLLQPHRFQSRPGISSVRVSSTVAFMLDNACGHGVSCDLKYACCTCSTKVKPEELRPED